MKKTAFQPGDRIRISSKYHWAKGAAGTIAGPPEFARKLVEEEAPWVGHHRYVRGRNHRLIEFFFVWFDEPQIDADGDGPYTGGEIEAEYIELLRR